MGQDDGKGCVVLGDIFTWLLYQLHVKMIWVTKKLACAVIQ